MAKLNSELCQKIKERVHKWENYWTENRNTYYFMMDFIMGNQWDDAQAKLFERYDKSPLIVNKLGVLVNHMKGDQIQNTPNLQIVPDSNVTAEEAEIRSALIKNITFNSDSKTVFQTCYGQAIVGGYSGFIIGAQYIDEESCEQEIKIFNLTDPNMCYWDKSAKEISKIDGKHCGFKTRMSRAFFKDKYGQDIERQIGSSSLSDDSMVLFDDDDSITVVDDYEKVKISDIHTIYKLSDGSTVNNKQLKEFEKIKIDGKKFIMKDGNALSILDERKTVKYKIMHRQIAGDFVLEETEFSSSILPIVFVDQDSYYDKNGRQITRSFFKDAIDSQKFLNYIATQSAYLLKTLRYDQFLVPRSAVQNPDTQQIWRDPSIQQGGLLYDQNSSGDKPEKLNPPELSGSLSHQYERALLDIQTSTGIYNTQLGEQGNEVSGTAIRRRNLRGQKNTQTSRTSIERAITAAGIIINDMIPKVYDTQRTIVISTAQSSEQKIEINKPIDEYGLLIQNDMTKGKYKIYIKPGMSYEGQKEEALESLQSVLMADKSGNAFSMVADMYVENLPLDNSIELRNRFRTMVPQEIIEAGKTGKPLPPKPPQPTPEQQMLALKQQELQMKAQQSQVEMQRKMQELELKKAELQRKAIESHQDMSFAWERLEAEKQEAAAELENAMLRYQGEMQRIGADINIAESNNIIRLLTHQSKQPKNIEI